MLPSQTHLRKIRAALGRANLAKLVEDGRTKRCMKGVGPRSCVNMLQLLDVAMEESNTARSLDARTALGYTYEDGFPKSRAAIWLRKLAGRCGELRAALVVWASLSLADISLVDDDEDGEAAAGGVDDNHPDDFHDGDDDCIGSAAAAGAPSAATSSRMGVSSARGRSVADSSALAAPASSARAPAPTRSAGRFSAHSGFAVRNAMPAQCALGASTASRAIVPRCHLQSPMSQMDAVLRGMNSAAAPSVLVPALEAVPADQLIAALSASAGEIQKVRTRRERAEAGMDLHALQAALYNALMKGKRDDIIAVLFIAQQLGLASEMVFTVEGCTYSYDAQQRWWCLERSASV